jgi:osmotically-inducible protein OsmY
MGGGIANEIWMSEADDHVREAELQRRVWDELEREPTLETAEVRVEVVGDVATLSGTVPSLLQRLAVERVADRVEGLTDVINRLTVEPSPADRHGDAELEDVARLVLAWHAAVPRDALRVAVRGGVARLDGRVPHEHERIAAVDAVTRLRGVRAVEDAIVVEWPGAPGPIAELVRDAIAHDPRLRGRHIEVDAFGPSVVLRGRVRTLEERLEAEEVARCVPGVTRVADYLRVAR